MPSTGSVDHQVAAEIARRAARRLEVLAEERPDLLAQRLERWDARDIQHLLSLTRLPDPLAAHDPPHPHLGIRGVDHCTESLVSGDREPAHGLQPLEYVRVDISDLDDEDLLAARHFIAETLPGNVLG